MNVSGDNISIGTNNYISEVTAEMDGQYRITSIFEQISQANKPQTKASEQMMDTIMSPTTRDR